MRHCAAFSTCVCTIVLHSALSFSPRATPHPSLSLSPLLKSTNNGCRTPLAPLGLAATATTTTDTAPNIKSRPEISVKPYQWQNYTINAIQSGPPSGQPIVLIHGFGCSTTYWRETIATLADAGYSVHAVDLLGQGKSSKPTTDDDVYYSINLWASIVDDYVRDVVVKQQKSNLFDGILGSKKTGGNDGVILIGNSLGSLVALAAAVGDHSDSSSSDDDDDDAAAAAAHLPGKVAGICMFNCGVGLNSRGIVDEPQWSSFQRLLFTLVLNTLDALLFNNPPVLKYILDEIVTPDLLRDALRGLYRYDPSRVDDELVMSFYHPAKEAGAADALRQIYTNDPGKSPMQIHEKHEERLEGLPIHLVWGDDDAVTPLDGGVGMFYSALAKDESMPVTMDVIERTGHIPFDDNIEASNESMLRWLNAL